MQTIVAIHGNGGGAFRFSRTLPLFPDDVQFVAVTLPGFADVPRDLSITSMRGFADALYAGVMAGWLPQGWLATGDVKLPLAERPFILLGTGIGGSIALEYAQHYGDTLAGLVLHAPVGTRIDTRLFPRLMKLPGMRRLGQFVFSERPFRPIWRRLLFSEPLPPHITTQFFDEYAQCQVFGQMFDLITADWFDGLRPLSLPAALLWGEQERVLSVDQLEDYKTILTNPRIRTVPNWDHFPMLEQPQEFVDELMGLVEGW